MTNNPTYSEAELRIHLGHIYAHLNRAWRQRLVHEEMTETEWGKSREFPDDIQPIA
jgi:hypothetical protein